MTELNRKHGIDWGRWRQWAEPDDPPRRLDFVIAGVTSGDHVNQMWEANRLPLADFRENGGVVGLYHFYEPVNALSQVKVFMKCVEEIQPQFVAVDFEKLYKEQVLGKTDVIITKQIIQELYKYFDHDKVLVYCGHDSWANLLMKYEPAFFGQCEFWLTWPNDAGENTVAFKPAYASLMGRAFDEVRIFQYSWDGDAEAYGILNGPTDIDLNVYVHKQPFDEWLGITDEPEEPEDPGEEPNEPPVDPGEGDIDMGLLESILEELQAVKNAVVEVSALLVQIRDQQPGDNGGNTGGGNEEPPPPPPPQTVGKQVFNTDTGKVFLFFAEAYNKGNPNAVPPVPPRPVFGIYPKSSSPVSDRIWVDSGATVQCFPEPVKGDGGAIGYVVDKSQLVAHGAPVPADVTLYIHSKFL